MKKVVISGSSKLQGKVDCWIKVFENNGCEVIDYPKAVDSIDYNQKVLTIYKEFFPNIENSDLFFLMNEDKDGIKGHVGPSAFAELTYAIMQNLLHGKKIEIYILNMPGKEASLYEELTFWLEMGLIKLWEPQS